MLTLLCLLDVPIAPSSRWMNLVVPLAAPLLEDIG
jgi:hypothetical protein